MNKSFIFILITGLSLVSCKKDASDPAVDCASNASRDMEAFFNAIHTQPEYALYETMDLTTHEYYFVPSVDIQICGIGYKSQNNSLNYDMVIEDNSGVLYSGTHSFDSAQFSYVSVPPVTLIAGTTYTIKRTVSTGNLNETIGPVTRESDNGGNIVPFNFPVNLGQITITGSSFYGMGGPVDDYGIPNIYFEYIEL